MKDRDSLRRWCAQLHDDDGVDPRRYFASHQSRSDDRKNRQLCRQAFRVLSLVFPGEFNDRTLQDVFVVDVSPAPDPSRLLVRFGTSQVLSTADRARIMTSLERVRGRLRQELAQAVTRRRIPDFTFEVIALPEVTP